MKLGSQKNWLDGSINNMIMQGQQEESQLGNINRVNLFV